MWRLTDVTLPILQMKGIVKRFQTVVANNSVDFSLRPGEIHALLGENGAGKTTLMNILYGLIAPDTGEIVLRGERVQFSSPSDAIQHGIGMVHQHFMLVRPLTVAENIILGQPSPREPLIEKMDAVHQRIQTLSEQYGLTIDPAREVWTLSVGEEQRVEIVKALYRGAEILVLDEPTAVLTPGEVDDFLAVLRRLAKEGRAIVFISHKLREVMACSDRVTVLRDGSLVSTVATRDTSPRELARLMVGRETRPAPEKTKRHISSVLLSVHGLCADSDRGLPALENLSFEVRSGEILGIAGVEGNGQAELEQAIAGLRKTSAGSIRILDTEVAGASPKQIADLGLAHVPSDRYRWGLLGSFSIAENLILQRIGEAPFTKRGLLQQDQIQREAQTLAADFDVRVSSIDARAGSLSGGNAQKIILARELARQPQVLMVAQPTRGLDIRATEYVHSRLIEQRNQGKAILLISTELDEILALSDTIAVLYEGQIVGVFDADTVDVTELGLRMTGVKSGSNPDEVGAMQT